MHFLLLSGLLVYPFIQFIIFQRYPVFTAEVILILALLVGVAFLFTRLCQQRRFVLSFVYTALIYILINGQLAVTTAAGYLLRSLIFLPVFLFLLKIPAKRQFSVVSFFLVGMILTDFFVSHPSHLDLLRNNRREIVETQQTEERPQHILYLIVDEHLGLDGLPQDIPTSQPMRVSLRDFYLSRGFTIYPKAYSNYFSTEDTLSNVLNFSLSDQHASYFSQGQTDRVGYRLKSNFLFDHLHAKGKAISVYESTAIDFCSEREDVARCLVYPKNAIIAVAGDDYSLKEKLWVIGSQYVASNTFLREVFYDLINANILKSRTGPLRVVPQTIERLRHDILKAPTSTLFFGHLLMPHFPYVYDQDCKPRPVAEWEGLFEYNRRNLKNSPQAYARKYDLYYDQVECLEKQLGNLFAALQQAGMYDDLTIVIHGDHGSRINRFHDPYADVRDQISSQDVATSFSTLMVVKQPNQKQGQERNIQGSVKNIVESELIHHRPFQGEEEAFVYFKQRPLERSMVKVPMVKL